MVFKARCVAREQSETRRLSEEIAEIKFSRLLGYERDINDSLN